VSDRKKIAAVITEYRPGSHAVAIVTKFLKGFPTDGGLLAPRVDLVSMYVDQFPEQDLSRNLSEEHGVPIYNSIVKALTLGGKELAVDGVLLIGEHGDYAWNEKDQHLFPRKYFMEQICGVFATSGRSVPVFNDKHLAYSWADAKWMYDRAAQLDAPFMAGSSFVTCWRNPWLEHELESPIQEALAIGFSGLDIYGFHTIDALQCMVERRKGGETGVVAVTCLEGDAVWRAAREGAWSAELSKAASDVIEKKPDGSMEDHAENPAAFLIEYSDGLKATVLMLTGYVVDLSYAARVGDDVLSCEFFLHPGPPHPHFSYLCMNIEEMFLTGKPQYPVERTLLASGILEAAMDSRHQGGKRLETPHLDVSYKSYETAPKRPAALRPEGASLVPFEEAQDQ
jgi:hypothetical protein